MSTNYADVLFGAALAMASLVWLAAGRPDDDRGSRSRHPSALPPLTPPGAAAAPTPPLGNDRGAGRTS